MSSQDTLIGLKSLCAKLTKEIQSLSETIAPLSNQLKLQQERLETTKKLISLMEEVGSENNGAKEQLFAPVFKTMHRNHDPNGEGDFSPTHVYWPAILSTLVNLGGRARSETVTDEVGKLLKTTLKPNDYERLPSGVVRWRNRVAWQRLNMINEGLLRSGSPRGIWEITENGRAWLRTN